MLSFVKEEKGVRGEAKRKNVFVKRVVNFAILNFIGKCESSKNTNIVFLCRKTNSSKCTYYTCTGTIRRVSTKSFDTIKKLFTPGLENLEMVK